MITKYKIFENVNQFKVGDKVDYLTPENIWESGIVLLSRDPKYLIKFDNKWREMHNGKGLDPDCKSWWCGYRFLRKHVKKERRFTQYDPYGEEEWEIENEKNKTKLFENIEFKIGDRVEFKSYASNDWETGTIVSVDDSACLVKFDRKWSDVLHDGDGRDLDKKSFWCNLHDVRKYIKRERRFTSEDPYGEEEWEIENERKKIKLPKLSVGKYKINYKFTINSINIFMKLIKFILLTLNKLDDNEKNKFKKVDDIILNLLKGSNRIVSFLNKKRIRNKLEEIEKLKYTNIEKSNELINSIKDEYQKIHNENLMSVLINYVEYIKYNTELDDFSKEIESIKNLITKIRIDDPYGEEDWDE